MPLVADAREPTTDPIGELLAKFARPLPHGFVTNNDAAGSQQLLNHTQPEREPEVQPDGVADDLGRGLRSGRSLSGAGYRGPFPGGDRFSPDICIYHNDEILSSSCFLRKGLSPLPA